MEKCNTENLLKHLNEKWHNTKCLLCQSDDWSANDSVFELRQFNQGDLTLGNTPILPVIPITCKNCGNTVLINAMIAKVIESPTNKEIKNE